MTAYSFKNPKFIKTAIEVKDYPVLRDPSGKLLPEVAVVGRSNVGKSSLLNHLFHVKDLVRTSSTPGKTQAINFFTLNNQLAFVDLPGYGFAQVPFQVRKEWGPMIQRYLQSRTTVKVVLLLIDIRRIPDEDDRMLVEWMAFHQKAMIVVMTKIDKVNQQERHANTQKILAALNAENVHFIHYSVNKNIGRNQLIAMLTDAIKNENAVEE